MVPAFRIYWLVLIERLVHRPDFPDPADQVGAGFQDRFARAPARRRGFGALAFADQLESLDLAQGFADVASHRRGEHFIGLHDPIGIDEESTAYVYASLFVMNAVH